MTIIGTTSRFVSGRSAVQTVYWRAANSAKNGDVQPKLVKTNRTFNYPVPSSVATSELPASRTSPQPIKSFH
ncbi:hypothetical protein LSTR_LSTR002936 [Laodelphax striatellus]|uniref:Uncharacterized protein n=1 Tax=Laodelphax striatellus TaxID=195883 RepID=A0A482XLP1_LAOST|nr:hypothetical protein LSTR_LSTR002936 [Laodelphax striatellus]